MQKWPQRSSWYFLLHEMRTHVSIKTHERPLYNKFYQEPKMHAHVGRLGKTRTGILSRVHLKLFYFRTLHTLQLVPSDLCQTSIYRSSPATCGKKTKTKHQAERHTDSTYWSLEVSSDNVVAVCLVCTC